MNTHSINDDESDIDALESLTTSHASSISSINSNITTINNKLSGSSSSGLKTLTTTNLDGINGILNHTTTSNLKSFVDANSAKITYPSADSTKLGLIGITSSVNLNSLVTQSNANVSDITSLENAYPRNTILTWYASQTGNIYTDGSVTLNWDGANRQLRFSILNIASNQYVTGGVLITKFPSNTIQITNYLSVGVSTAFKYFTGSQVPANSSYLNTTYNLPSYTRAIYWLQPFSLTSFPTYQISVFVGSSFSYMRIHIKKYNN